MKTDQSAFLNHILDAVEKIEKYIQDIDEESFKKNRHWFRTALFGRLKL